MSGAKAAFAPLPTRAIGDKRFSGLHFRVLAAIAMHDRMSGSRGKGQGCWAGNKTLAVECGCDYSRLSATITDLGRWGYVEREQHPLNKRLRVYRITYTDADIAFTKASNSLPVGKQSPDDAEQIVCEPAKSEAETVCRDFEKTEQFRQAAEVNIFRETGKILGETFEIDSAEAAPLGSDAPSLNVGGVLARFERALKEGRLPGKQTLLHWRDWLEELHDSLDINDPNSGRAYRLLEEVDWPEEVWSEHPPATSTAKPAGPHRDCYYDRGGASGEAPMAMRKASEPERRLVPYPKLYEAFEDEPTMIEALDRLPRDIQHDASKRLALEGREAAAAFVREQAA